MKRAAIYVRESTNFQDPESQYKECLKYCEENNFQVIKKYQYIASGKSNTRKGFLQMQQDMEDGLFNVVVLWELSRSTRDFITYKMMIQRMFDLGVELYSLQEGKLTENDIDTEFSNDLKALLNSRERKIVGRRIKFRKKFTKSEGYWTGGIPPLGYTTKDKILTIVPEEAAMVREIFNLFISGMSRGEIARRFNIPDVRKVRRMLVNPIYIGKLKMNETEITNDRRSYNKNYEIVQGRHEPIIDEETFNLAVAMSKNITREKYQTDVAILPRVYWYNGDPMYPLIGDRSRKKIYYQAKFSYDVVELNYLEEVVIKGLISDLDKMTVLKTIDTEDNFEEQKEFYSAFIKKLEAQKKKLLKKYLDEKIDEETFDNFNDKIEKDIKEATIKYVELEKLQQNQERKEDNIEILKEYLHLLKNTNDRKELRKILKILICEVRMVNNFRPIIITNIF